MRFSAFILLFLHLFSFGQLVDDFEDGSFLTTPIWGGDISKFVIENGSLKSNSTIVPDQFYLSTKNSSIVLEEWQINVNMRFSTSSANYTDIFLISDSEDLTQVSNGYFVRIGNTKDEISLYKIENGSTSQFVVGRLTKSVFSLAANTISPDGDGYQDLLALNYNVGNGVTLNGYVFNLSGKLVSHIHNQETLATEGIITWNGFLENGTKIPVGNYILLLESYNLDEETTKQKIAFSVQGNF
jgi:hypothetical protein